MSKQDTLNSVLAILSTHGVSNEALNLDLTALFANKGRTNEFPNILNEDGTIKEKYCLCFKEYRPISEFKESKRSPDGYHWENKLAEKILAYHTKMAEKCLKEIQDKTNEFLENPELISLDDLKEFKKSKEVEAESHRKARNDKIIVDAETLTSAGFKLTDDLIAMYHNQVIPDNQVIPEDNQVIPEDKPKSKRKS